MSQHRVSTLAFYAFVIALTNQPVFANDLALELGLGNAISRDATTSLNNHFIDTDILAQARANKRRHSWQATLGYHLSPQLQIRVSYVELGPVDTTLVGRPIEVNTFLNTRPTIPLNTVSGWLISTAYQYTLSPVASLRAKVGLYAWEASYSLKGRGFHLQSENSGTNPSLGFDLGIRLSPKLTGRIGWEVYEIDTDKTDLLSIAIEFH